MGKWDLWSFRMPPELYDALKSAAQQSERTMSDIVRQGTWSEIEATGTCSAEVVEAARIVLRERKERLKVMKAKTRHRTALLPVQAWNSIQEERAEYERLDMMDVDIIESWIKLLEDNKATIDEDNPVHDVVQARFDLLIDRLREEAQEYKVREREEVI